MREILLVPTTSIRDRMKHRKIKYDRINRNGTRYTYWIAWRDGHITLCQSDGATSLPDEKMDLDSKVEEARGYVRENLAWDNCERIFHVD